MQTISLYREAKPLYKGLTEERVSKHTIYKVVSESRIIPHEQDNSAIAWIVHKSHTDL
jgi:hypothetical protein